MTQLTAEPKRIAYFVSPHGFGHAARAAAVINAVQELNPAIRFEIFTQVPHWFFQQSLGGSFGYHACLTDIGLVQTTALVEDLPATIERLNEFLPFPPELRHSLAATVRELNCELVLCDIAPLGIAVAQAAERPSILLENFTWDWIYEGYGDWREPLAPHIDYLRELFESADYRIQLEPICARRPAELYTHPVSRKPATPADQIRHALGLPAEAQVVLISMGGIPDQYPFLNCLQDYRDIHFVIPGARTEVERRANLILLPHASDFYHPDLVNAADAVISKLGYSTVAEVYHAGLPFGYLTRAQFRESGELATFVEQHMKGLALPPAEFHTGEWLTRLPNLLALPRLARNEPNGADQVAAFLLARWQFG